MITFTVRGREYRIDAGDATLEAIRALVEDRDRYRTLSFTTLVACAGCGRGYRVRELVDGVCAKCWRWRALNAEAKEVSK